MTAAEAAFTGTALLFPDTELIATMAREIGRPDLAAMIESDREAIAAEHVRLFYNPAGAPCPPWQSAHLDPPRLMGEPHLSALMWYRRFGSEPRSENEPADHLGLLLLFYSQLLQSGAAAELVAEFRSAHLAWARTFAGCIQQNTSHPFYAEFSRLLADSLDGS